MVAAAQLRHLTSVIWNIVTSLKFQALHPCRKLQYALNSRLDNLQFIIIFIYYAKIAVLS